MFEDKKKKNTQWIGAVISVVVDFRQRWPQQPHYLFVVFSFKEIEPSVIHLLANFEGFEALIFRSFQILS